jgi:hypothetical protein
MNSTSSADPKREMLRHTLATLAYRGAKALRNTPASFADFQGCEGMRTPGQILAHVGDLMDWALSITAGKQAWHDSEPLPWEKERARFFVSLTKLDQFLESGEPLHAPVEKLFQGSIADAFTHVGQISLLRRLAGAPVKAENYFTAEIVRGRVGAEQAAPRQEF